MPVKLFYNLAVQVAGVGRFVMNHSEQLPNSATVYDIQEARLENKTQPVSSNQFSWSTTLSPEPSFKKRET